MAPSFTTPGGKGGVETYYNHALNGNFVQAIGDDFALGADDWGNYLVFTTDGNGQPLAGTSV